MISPGLSEPIVAISTAWEAAPIGIVRASGVDLLPLAEPLGIQLPAVNHPQHWSTTLCVEGIRLPADVFWFPTSRWRVSSLTFPSPMAIHVSIIDVC